MSTARLKEIAVRPWKEVVDLCKDAAVFLDDSAADLLHWAGGLELLSGCLGVYDMYKDLNPVARDFIATVSEPLHIEAMNTGTLQSLGSSIDTIHGSSNLFS